LIVYFIDVFDKKYNKDRKFIEKIELHFTIRKQILKSQKKLSGTVKLPYGTRSRPNICILVDQKHKQEAKKLNLYYLELKTIKNIKTKKKTIKKLVKRFGKFAASESIIKEIPRYLGPALAKFGKFPSVLHYENNLEDQVF